MKNILYFNNTMECVLLVNEAEEGNTIWLEIETDASTNPTLEILIDETTTTVDLEASTNNEYQLTTEYWNYGGTTSFRLVNDDYTSDYIVLNFPEVINTDSSLYFTSAEHYSMQGSFNVQQAVEDLQETDADQQIQIDDISLKILEYILPTSTSTSAIADGSNSNVLTFEFNNTQSGAKTSFYSCLNFTVATTVDSSTDTYGDCTLTVTFKLDGTTIATLTETYGDGSKVLMLNYLLQNLNEGNHTFIVNFAVAGGSIS